MNKRYLSGVIIFILLLAVIFASYMVLEYVCVDTLDTLEIELQNISGDEIADCDYLQRAEKKWAMWEAVLSSIAPHNKIEDVNVSFRVCSGWKIIGDPGEYYAELCNLKALIEIVRDVDKASLQRVF